MFGLGAVVSAVGSLFDSGSAAKKAVDVIHAISGNDPEQAKDLKREYTLRWLKATQGSKKARRFIAVIVSVTWGIWANAFMVCWLVGVDIPTDALSFWQTVITPAFLIIMTFYFGKDAVEKFAERRKSN